MKYTELTSAISSFVQENNLGDGSLTRFSKNYEGIGTITLSTGHLYDKRVSFSVSVSLKDNPLQKVYSYKRVSDMNTAFSMVKENFGDLLVIVQKLDAFESSLNCAEASKKMKKITDDLSALFHDYKRMKSGSPFVAPGTSVLVILDSREKNEERRKGIVDADEVLLF